MKSVLFLSAGLLVSHVLFAQWTTSGSNIYSSNTGNVGIGTTTPAYKLDVSGGVHSTSTYYSDAFTAGNIALYARGSATGVDGNLVLQSNNSQAYWITGANGYLRIGGNGGTEPSQGAINIDYNGNVAIGTLNTTAGYKFGVNGSAVFDAVTVKSFSSNNPKATPWADYVFDRNYQLPTLESLGEYIRQNRHLPGIPTAAEVEKNGIDLGATQARLLEKIEQLTLYTIDLQKQVDALKQQIAVHH